MPTKKLAPAKASEPKPKYSIGFKGWAIVYHKGKPEDLFEVQIASRVTRENELTDISGKKTGMSVSYLYNVRSASPLSFANLIMEEEIYPSFQAAANKFAQSFTTLLK